MQICRLSGPSTGCKKLGMRLDSWLRQTGYSAAKLARDCETSQATISRLRAGKGNWSFDLVRRIFERTGGAVTPNDFLELPPETNTKATPDHSLGAG